MRTVLYFVTVVATAALVAVAAAWLWGLVPPSDLGSRASISAAVSLLGFGPLVLGSVALDGGRRVSRWRIAVLAVSTVAAIALIGVLVRAGATVWPGAVAIVLGGVLVVVAVPVATAVRRSARRSDRWIVPGLEDVPSVVRIVATTFLVATAVMVSAALTLGPVVHPHPGGDLSLALPALGFSFLAAAVVASLLTLHLRDVLRDTTGGDPALRGRIRALVFRRRPVPLDDRERAVAARYAAASVVVLSVQTGQLVLLYTGLSWGFLQDVVRRTASTFDDVVLPLYVVLAVVVVVVNGSRIRRAREFARNHAALLGPAD